MDIVLLVLHVFLSLGIITLVLLQKGAGASAGAAFGGGGAGSVFGATGSANFLSKTTAILAIGFFINSLVLAYMASHRDMETGSVLDELQTPPPAATITTEEAAPDDIPVPAAIPQDDMVSDDGVPAADGAISEDDIPPPADE